MSLAKENKWIQRRVTINGYEVSFIKARPAMLYGSGVLGSGQEYRAENECSGNESA